MAKVNMAVLRVGYGYGKKTFRIFYENSCSEVHYGSGTAGTAAYNQTDALCALSRWQHFSA